MTFKSTDTFRMNEWPHNDEYIPFKFISGLNILGHYYDEEHDYHGYVLSFNKDSKHLPEKLKSNLPNYNALYVWGGSKDGDFKGYYAVESDSEKFLTSFFYREKNVGKNKVDLYNFCRTEWPYKHYLVTWCSKNNKWNKYSTLLERWQSGNACDC